ncbi:hypothetical protein DYB25_001192 [Aphanomyces astaci]|uniref:Uncharacterized protein n=1 Tax=Aphanomyces astaci TaxID=112090 RepID=A0A397BNG7_APHAT|nr:hypothetical protein DYB25_001192 [Aphanomyces astaci]
MADNTTNLSTTAHYTLAIEDVETSSKPVVDAVGIPRQKTTSSSRVVCLDVFRGITIFAMIFVNLGGGGLEAFTHVAWNGLEVADVIFPFFAWIMGVTMNIGMASHVRKGPPPWRILLDSFVRSVKLFLLGLVVNNVRNLNTGRITGVLQSFGFGYLLVTTCIIFGGIVKSDVRKWQQRAVEASSMLAFVLANVLITFYLPVHGCPTGYIENDIEGCVGGAHLHIDLLLFGEEHMYIPGFNDPEGFLNWFMVAFMAYIGYVVGGSFLQARESRHKLMVLIGAGICLVFVGLALTGFSVVDGPIPINKQMWSLSFVLTVAGLASLSLALLYAAVDKFAIWSGMPFMQNGMNAIALYAASEVVVTCATHSCNTSGINISFPYTYKFCRLTSSHTAITSHMTHQNAAVGATDSSVAAAPSAAARRPGCRRSRRTDPSGEASHDGAAQDWLFDGKSVLEVGSGLGLSGIVAGAYSRRTILTDYQQDTLKALAYNVMLNQTMGTTVEHLDWDHLDKVPCYVELWKSVAYLVNATGHSRFGVGRLRELLLAPPFDTTIVPVETLPDGRRLLDTVWDAEELRYEHYTIRLK